MGLPRSPWVAVLVGLVTTAVTSAQLFLGGTVGLADNGDGPRLMCALGLQSTGSTQYGSFTSTYVPGGTCSDSELFAYETSWRLVVGAAHWLSRAVTGEETFDLAAVAWACAVLLGVAVAALYLALPGRVGRRLVLCALVVVAVTDIGFVSYFNSAYSDPAGLIGAVFVLAGLVGLVVHRSWGWLVLLALSLTFVATAKLQLLTVAVAVAVALVASRRHWARPPVSAGRRTVRRLGLAASVVLVGSSAVAGVVASQQGEGFTSGNQMNLLFYTILADSPDPAADLRDMGLPPELAAYAGISAWEPEAPYFDPAVLANEDVVFSWGTYARFLLEHPGRFAHLLSESVNAVPDARVDYLGNVPVAEDADPVLVDRPSPVFGVLHLLPDWPGPLLLLVWVGAGLGGLWAARSAEPGRAARGVLLVGASVYAFTQSAGALSDGYYELAKHNVHAALATGVLLAVLLDLGLGALHGRLRARRCPQPAGPPEVAGSAA